MGMAYISGIGDYWVNGLRGSAGQHYPVPVKIKRNCGYKEAGNLN